jgi:hypothetical protein
MTVSGVYKIQNHFIYQLYSVDNQPMKRKLLVKQYTPPDPPAFGRTDSFRRESKNPVGV